jgi:hypothetical protein
MENSSITYGHTQEAWDELGHALADAWSEENPVTKATAIALGWSNGIGPTLAGAQTANTLTRISGIAAEQGYHELPREKLRAALEASAQRWMEFRQRQGV